MSEERLKEIEERIERFLEGGVASVTVRPIGKA